MPYRLIKEGEPRLHDYTSMYWGHNIVTHSQKDKFFKDLQTYELHCSIFSSSRLSKGDLICRNMQSGKIGLYEITELEQYRDPGDMYSVSMILCGYLVSGKVEIQTGYGITNDKLKELNFVIRDWSFFKIIRKFLGLSK